MSSFRRRAMALITVLCLSVLLLVLGLTFLTFIETDYRFAAEDDRRQQAYYLALAGLEYQRRHTHLLHPTPGVNTTLAEGPKAVPAGSLTHFFEVTVEPDGRITSRGFVRNSFRELASHKLMIDPGKSIMQARSVP